ncbi:hypothetical protein HZA87_02020 [Candidatus Uhrbacteria bacterium]|nr:hypothetical protein [Candidatus Uhrbacteria bacterium]
MPFLRWIATGSVRPNTFPDPGIQEVTHGFPLVSKEGSGATRFGQSALNANDNDGEVRVNRNDPDNLSVPYDNEGGRAVEAVNC